MMTACIFVAIRRQLAHWQIILAARVILVHWTAILLVPAHMERWIWLKMSGNGGRTGMITSLAYFDIGFRCSRLSP
jgi:hypothetical protein